MIIFKDCHNKENSIYLCDRCEEKLVSNNRRIIYVEFPELKTKKKKWDLCHRCYKALCKGLSKKIKRL